MTYRYIELASKLSKSLLTFDDDVGGTTRAPRRVRGLARVLTSVFDGQTSDVQPGLVDFVGDHELVAVGKQFDAVFAPRDLRRRVTVYDGV